MAKQHSAAECYFYMEKYVLMVYNKLIKLICQTLQLYAV